MSDRVNDDRAARVLVSMERTAGDVAVSDGAARSIVTFEEFFRSEHARLFGALCLMTGDGHEAEDVMQEAFTRVWERWDRVREMRDPVGYLYRSAFNTQKSRLRRAGVALRRHLRPSPGEDPLALVEQRFAIVHAMRALTPRERAALVLTDLLDHSSEEAGTVLGIRPSTVRVLAARGRSAMKERIGERP